MRDSRGKFAAGGTGKGAAGGASAARGAADESPAVELPSAVGGPGKDAAGGASAAGGGAGRGPGGESERGGAGSLCGTYPAERTKHRKDGPHRGSGGTARAPAGGATKPPQERHGPRGGPELCSITSSPSPASPSQRKAANPPWCRAAIPAGHRLRAGACRIAPHDPVPAAACASALPPIACLSMEMSARSQII
jgi:hypothetical protein